MSRKKTLLAALLLSGCATASASGGSRADLFPGSPEAEPSMEVLPQPDVDVSHLSERLRFAWLLAEESFEVQAPPVPVRPDAEELQAWSDGALEEWLEAKNHRVEAARAELDAAAEESHRQRIIAGALVGLLYEDVARVLLAIPVPEDLLDEPEIAAIYRDIIDFQARPYLAHARRAYRACRLNAVTPPGMRHFADFCAARAERLPEDDGGSHPRERTVVTVTVD